MKIYKTFDLYFTSYEKAKEHYNGCISFWKRENIKLTYGTKEEEIETIYVLE